MDKAEKQRQMRERQMRLRALRDRQRIENIRKHFDQKTAESKLSELGAPPKLGNRSARERRREYAKEAFGRMTPEQRQAHRERKTEAQRRSRARRKVEFWMTGYDGPSPQPGNVWAAIIEDAKLFGGGVPSDRKRNRVKYRDYRPLPS